MGGNTNLERVSEGARRQWAADRALRPPMRSPDRPKPSRAVQREFWRLIARGTTTVEAALEVGVSRPAGARWFRHAGGMPPISLDKPSGRYLSFAEREEIALLRARGKGVREIGRSIGRDAGTLAWAASQRSDTGRQARVPIHGGAVEGAAGGQTPEDGQAGRIRGCASTYRTA